MKPAITVFLTICLFFSLSMFTKNNMVNNEKHEEATDDVMEYKNIEIESEFAKLLPFNKDKLQVWAVAYLGYGESGRNNKDAFIKKYFSALPQNLIDSVRVFEFEGDEWYIIIPRYKNMITELSEVAISDAGEIVTANEVGSFGTEPLVIRCNPSDIYPSVRIRTSFGGGYEYLPTISLKDGRLRQEAFILDLTEYDFK